MKGRMLGISGVIPMICMGLAGAMLAADEGITTSSSLQKAYNAELNSKARYEAFTAKADEEGYRSVAILLRAAAYSEAIHAKRFAVEIAKTGGEPKMLPEPLNVKSTRENLEACLKGQTSVDESMYPNLIEEAEANKDSTAAMLFKAAYAAEVEQAKFFKAALAGIDGWKEPGKEFAVCQVCGYIVMGQPPMTCPVCSAPPKTFKVFSKYTIMGEMK